ncbi:MAG: hypothetical protein K2Y22_16070 [Candidatus Obscuribacterales bacterium]|nr:hypothetical protein [Candidatus Obscuribacterales bacterium]
MALDSEGQQVGVLTSNPGHSVCRKRASKLFSKERMAMEYEELYRILI